MNVKGNRLLRTDSSRHVVPLWTSLMEEEYRARGKSDVHLLIERDGKMCRQCFTTFERASKMLESISGSVAKAANILIPDVAHPTLPCNSLPTPKRPRYSALNSVEQSPKVKVSIYN